MINIITNQLIKNPELSDMKNKFPISELFKEIEIKKKYKYIIKKWDRKESLLSIVKEIFKIKLLEHL